MFPVFTWTLWGCQCQKGNTNLYFLIKYYLLKKTTALANQIYSKNSKDMLIVKGQNARIRLMLLKSN